MPVFLNGLINERYMVSVKLMSLPNDHFKTDVNGHRSDISKDNNEDRSAFQIHFQEKNALDR